MASFDFVYRKFDIRTFVNNVWVDVSSHAPAGDPFSMEIITARLVVDSDDNIFLAYIYEGQLSVLKYSGNSWTPLNAHSSGTSFTVGAPSTQNLELKLDQNGVLHVCYTDGGQGNRAILKKLVNDVWNPVGSATMSNESVSKLKLDFSSDGTPHILYQTSSSYLQIKKLNGTSWINAYGDESIVPVINFNLAGLDLLFDNNNVPFVSYSSLISGQQQVFVVSHDNTNSTWIQVGDLSSWTIYENSKLEICIDNDNRLYTAFAYIETDPYDARNKILIYDGDEWTEYSSLTDMPAESFDIYDLQFNPSNELFFVSLESHVSVFPIVRKAGESGFSIVGELGSYGNILGGATIAVDQNEVIYALGYDTNYPSFNGFSVMKLVNGEWEYVGNQGFNDQYGNITNTYFIGVDLNNELYLVTKSDFPQTGHKIWTLDESNIWQPINIPGNSVNVLHDSENNVYISYLTSTGNQSRIDKLENSVLTHLTNLPTTLDWPSQWSCLNKQTAIGSDSTIYYAHRQVLNGESVIRVQQYTNETWEFVGLNYITISDPDDNLSSLSTPNIIFDGNNKPYVSFIARYSLNIDEDPSGFVKIFTLENDLWIEVDGTETFQTEVPPTLDFDADNTLHICRMGPPDIFSPWPGMYYILKKTPQGWENVGMSPINNKTAVPDAGFSFSANNIPYFNYNLAGVDRAIGWLFAMNPIEISTTTVEEGAHCAGSQISYSFSTENGFIGPELHMNIQLSDEEGNFDSPINLGNIVGQPSGTFEINLPQEVASNGIYKIRIAIPDLGIIGPPSLNSFSILPSTLYYQDLDGDGYGNADSILYVCGQIPTNYVLDNTDCNDNDSNVWASETVDVEILWSGSDTLCINDDAISLFASVDGGIWTGSGITNDQFSPNSLTPGQYDITYSVDNITCTTGSASYLVTIEECPVVSVFYQDFDEDGYGNPDVSIEATEAPEGYVTNNQDCNDNDANVWLATPAASEIVWDNEIFVCLDQDDITLFGLPSNGNWSGDISSDVLSPQTLGTGDFEIFYTTLGDGVCVLDGVDTILVQIVNCIEEPLLFYLDLDGDGYGDPNYPVESDGERSGYVMNNQDCNDNDPTIWQATPIIVEITNEISVICQNSTAMALTGTPENGIWSGSGVESGQFHPSIAGIGSHSLTYTVAGDGACSLEGSDTYVVNVEDCTIGLNENEIPKLLVYPTMTSDYITISNDIIQEVTVIDGYGKRAASFSGNTENLMLNLGHLSSGIYFLKIRSINSTEVVRIVKH